MTNRYDYNYYFNFYNRYKYKYKYIYDTDFLPLIDTVSAILPSYVCILVLSLITYLINDLFNDYDKLS